MNFLQLVNQLRVECGVSGPPLTTVAGQIAGSENARMVSWIQQAWIDIQTSKEDWLFLREPFVFNTVATNLYTGRSRSDHGHVRELEA